MDIPIEIEDIVVPTAPARKEYYSKWHLLVNSNAKAYDVDTANRIADGLKQGVRCAFQDHAKEVFVIKKEGDSFDKEHIKKIEIKMAAEIGEKEHRVHVHALILVTHYTILQIDRKRLLDVLLECVANIPEVNGLFMRLKWIPADRPIENYIGKNPLRGQGDNMSNPNPNPNPETRDPKP